jgi:secretion/DNA translocation related CpaE-like protein
MNATRPLLVSNDADLIDEVLRLAAANGVEVHLAADAESARSRWSLAPLVIVGADAVTQLVNSRMGRRPGVVLLSHGPTQDDWMQAVALGAEHVVRLPDAERWLVDRIAVSGEGIPRDGRVVAIIGCGGGAGASTFAVTLALAAAARSLRVLLVDADPTGGGLDVLLGMEDVAGIRWPDLVETRGRLGAPSLDEALPHASGVAVLSWGREGPAVIAPDVFASVLDAGVRGYDLVVVDAPRLIDASTELVLSRSDETLLVTVNRVRATAAAARLAARLQDRCSTLGVVLRSDPKGVSDDVVLEALDIPVVGHLPFASNLAARADEGDLPSLRDAYGRACVACLRAMATTVRRVA